jgi:hypothetical protein
MNWKWVVEVLSTKERSFSGVAAAHEVLFCRLFLSSLNQE